MTKIKIKGSKQIKKRNVKEKWILRKKKYFSPIIF